MKTLLITLALVLGSSMLGAAAALQAPGFAAALLTLVITAGVVLELSRTDRLETVLN